MSNAKSCVTCRHFNISFGSVEYDSEYATGGPGSVDCGKQKQRALGPPERLSDPKPEEAFRAWVAFGNSCPEFHQVGDS